MNEAAKNSLFDPELLQEFATSLREIRETSSGTMSESEKKLNSASRSDSSQASQAMMQSAEFQQRALEELRKVLAKFPNNSTDLKLERLQKAQET